MQTSIDIPDQLIADALTASTRINQRQPEQDRKPEPLTFTDADATDVIFNFLTGLIIADLQQTAQIDQERSVRTKQQEIAALRQAAP